VIEKGRLGDFICNHCLSQQSLVAVSNCLTSNRDIRLTEPISEEFVREFQAGTVSGNVDKDHFETVIRESLKVPSYVWKTACEGMIEIDHTDELPRIKARTLLIWGDKDACFGHSEQQRLLKGIQGSQLKVYPGIGHAPSWECPERVAADVSAFVKKNTIKAAGELVAA
jgi:pimeloyl-ACP methyl ester carboxylesterase